MEEAYHSRGTMCTVSMAGMYHGRCMVGEGWMTLHEGQEKREEDINGEGGPQKRNWQASALPDQTNRVQYP